MTDETPKLLKLPRTKIALAAYDERMKVLDAEMMAAETNEEVYRVQAASKAAWLEVGKVFAEETSDRNSPDVARYLKLDPWFRNLVAKYG